MAPSALSTPNGQRVRLPDGRWLGYAEHGDPAGRPILAFRGAPASRLSYWPDLAIAASLAVRVISPERPGYGLSTFQPGRTMLDWPDDVAAFADALGLGRFAVAGVSGGAPYALACAYKIPQRLTGVAVVSGAGPLDDPALARTYPLARRMAFPVARHAPWLLRPLVWLLTHPGRRPEQVLGQMLARAPARDRAWVAQPAVRAASIAGYREAARGGVRGWVWEMVLLCQPWGFALADVEMEVHLWHGEEDASISPLVARHVAGQLPHCRAAFLPEEGHCLLYDHWEEILTALSCRQG